MTRLTIDLAPLFADSRDGTRIDPKGVDWTAFLERGAITKGGDVVGCPVALNDMRLDIDVEANVFRSPKGERGYSVSHHRFGMQGAALERDPNGNITKCRVESIGVFGRYRIVDRSEYGEPEIATALPAIANLIRAREFNDWLFGVSVPTRPGSREPSALVRWEDDGGRVPLDTEALQA